VAVFEKSGSLILENDFVKISISMNDSLVESVFDKINSRELKGESVHFFSFFENDKKTEIFPASLALKNDTVVVSTIYGDVEFLICEEKEYFTVELISRLPEKLYKAVMAHIKYSYDYNDKKGFGAAGIALTYWANPCFYPDCKDRETKAEAVRYLKDKGAKYALLIAPMNMHQDLLKKITLTIDKETGIRSGLGGAWGRESQLNHDNGMLLYYTEDEYVNNNMPFFKALGVDQIDVCQGGPSAYYQGSFEYRYHKDAADFKKRFSDTLAKNGMYPGLHTYAATIAIDCAGILSKPEYQKQLLVRDTFTLERDIDEKEMLIPVEEKDREICCDFTFLSKNSPIIIIGEEVIKYNAADGGFVVEGRGFAGTKAVCHKKGEVIRHINGLYYNLVPELESELFYDLARNTAKAFDDGGYKSIYLDALDTTYRFIDDVDDMWYYCAAFICELLRNCKKTPMIEASCMYPSMWAARGRFGAWDIGRRGYKLWNKAHAEQNKIYTDRYATGTLGWYSFYPTDAKHPGNFHTRYQYCDDIEHLGSVSVANNFNMVFNDIEYEDYRDTPALRRNIALFRKYDRLRKSYYFPEDILARVREGEWEYHIREKENGEFVFVEKDYQSKKLYDLKDKEKNCGEFVNPFENQAPFVRITAYISSQGENPLSLMKFDREKKLSEQNLKVEFEEEINLLEKCARRVSVLGNGKKGTVAIWLHGRETGRSGVMAYYIDTDFEGWREFILAESDNGDRKDITIDYDAVFNSPINPYLRHNADDDRTFMAEVKLCGDTEGVRISDIEAVDHTFEVLRNPTVRIGDNILTFNCDLKSTDYIEFDGNRAVMYDRIGNETKVEFSGSIKAPSGAFKAELSALSDSKAPLRASLTFGFTGKEIV